MSNSPAPRFQIIRRQGPAPGGRRRSVLMGIAWGATVLVAGVIGSLLGSGGGGDSGAADRQQAEALRKQVVELQQRQATLQASDRISRAAVNDVQASLAERDEEIAGLRADVAFYERLVGATSQRKGLNAHSIEFTQEAAGTWQYALVLTQNLNRGAISQGRLRFTVEGVKDGKLASVSWDELHQQTQVPGQEYSFRYFQQLTGNIMLPAGFTPQRVRVSLGGAGGGTTQVFDWKAAGSGGKGE